MLPMIDLFPMAERRDTGLHSQGQAFVADLSVAVLVAASAATLRLGIEHLVGGVAPFILTFPAVMAATLLRGGRAGAVATFLCQMLTIRYVFPNWISIHGGGSIDYVNVLLSTIALAGTVWATASYRDVAAQLRSRCQHKVKTLSLLMDEADHRTKNNYQLAAGLLARQSITAGSTETAQELSIASSRLETMASAYQELSTDVLGQQTVDLSAHIGRIVEVFEYGALPDNVHLRYRGDPIDVPVETAILTGLIVNEWITNALKYAFDGGMGCIFVDVTVSSGVVQIVVDDDGELTVPVRAGGRGNDLVRAFGDVLKGSISTDHDNGTRCVLTFPGATKVRHPLR